MAFKVNYPETPAGKRSVRRNIWGNMVGYVSGRRFWEFGSNASSERDADLWAKGYSLEAIQDGTAYQSEGLI